LEANSVPELKKLLSDQESELTRLRQATTPAGGEPERHAAAKKFEDMTAAEQEAEIRRLADEQDAQ
jgi:hypothetical protein